MVTFKAFVSAEGDGHLYINPEHVDYVLYKSETTSTLHTVSDRYLHVMGSQLDICCKLERGLHSRGMD